MEEISDGEGNVSRSDRHFKEEFEKITVKFAREKSKALKTKAHLDHFAELLNVTPPKDKKEAENLLFGDNPPKRWSNESLNQWQTNVLKALFDDDNSEVREAGRVSLLSSARFEGPG